MMQDLKEQGFRISLWQLPYFTRKNSLYSEIVESGYHVRNLGGELPGEDAILDFSNPAAVKWYQQKLAELLEQGASAIKVDFGEDAPWNGIYASGRSGYYEHNLYPLRYNQAAAEITKEITGDSIIWARSAWAGKPALSPALGRGCRKYRLGHGGFVAQWTLLWLKRFHLLES